MSIKNDIQEISEFLHSEFNSFTDLNAFEDRRKEILDNHWWIIFDTVSELEGLKNKVEHLHDKLEEMTEYKVAAHQLIGIPASVGIPEPIEGFAKRPQDIMPAVRDMALNIEYLLHDQPVMNDWINNKFPEHRQRVIVATDCGDVFDDHFYNAKTCQFVKVGVHIPTTGVTHWQPLPPPPKD